MIEENEQTIRESYTLPKNEQERLAKIQDKFSGIKPALKKSEIVRVGIYKVESLEEKDVKKILEEKLGRLSAGKPKRIIEQSYLGEVKINDKQWMAVAKLFPVTEKVQGRPKANYRQVMDGILYIFRYEIQRRKAPKEYSSYATCRRRLDEWRRTGLWKQICSSLVNNAYKEQKRQLEGILLRTWLIETDISLR